MKLSNIVIPTQVAEPGMRVRDIFRLCVEAGVPALPFRTSPGTRPDGRVSLHNVMKHGCIPEYMIELADVLGTHLSFLDDADQKVREILTKPVDAFVEKPLLSVSSHMPVLKVVAILEKHAASYMFVLDGDEYRGLITPLGIARRMLELENHDPGA